MSWLEIFTWFNVGVLTLGPVLVFVFFLRGLRSLIPRRPAPRDSDDGG